MSRLHSPSGDDYPAAARKHLLDAGVLLGGNRPDGAAYLSGYVVECALKSLEVLQTGRAQHRHSLSSIVANVNTLAAVAGATIAKYFGPATSGVHTAAIGGWRPEMRYQAPSMGLTDAQAWYACARAVFQETVHQMDLDGVL